MVEDVASLSLADPMFGCGVGESNGHYRDQARLPEDPFPRLQPDVFARSEGETEERDDEARPALRRLTRPRGRTGLRPIFPWKLASPLRPRTKANYRNT